MVYSLLSRTTDVEIPDSRIKGITGETHVSLVLSRLDNQWYRPLNSLLLRNRETGRLTQIDHVVVSVFGVFVIETKNYEGTIIGDAREDSWLRINDKGMQEIYSPTHQNYSHTKTLRSIIGEEIPIISIICFTDKAELLVNSGGVRVVTARNLQETIQSYKHMRLLLGQVDTLVDLILEANETSESAYIEHKEHIKQAKLTFTARRLFATCPKCGRPAVQRPRDTKPRFCEDFPKCTLWIPDRDEDHVIGRESF